MTHYLVLPDKQTWEALNWTPSKCGQYAHGPNGQFAVVGYGLDENGPVSEYWVDIPQEHSVPANLEQYRVVPQNPKRVFA